MKNKWRRITLGLAFASCVAMAGSACVVHTKGRVRARAVVVSDSNPPPAPKYVKVTPRAGYVWVRGHWEFRSNRWVWTQGHWERAKAGHRWQHGHWEKRGNKYHWIAGQWVAGGGGAVVRDHRKPDPAPAAYPTAAPPEPRYVTPGTRAGYAWVRGRWDWRGGRWMWTAGHWERAKAGHRWEPGVWKRVGNRYVWTEGRWVVVAGGGGGTVRDHRKPKPLPYPTTAPPARRAEKHASRAGYVWVGGRWDWKGGQWAWTAGHWERAKANHAWVAGRWEKRGNRYVWVAGSWKVQTRDHRKKKAPKPPPRKNEHVKSKRSH